MSADAKQSANLLDPARVAEIIALMHGEAQGFEHLVASLATELLAFHQLADPKDPADFDTTRRAAHALKGACLSIGAETLGRRFAEIECSAREGDAPAVAVLRASSKALSANSIHALRVAATNAANIGS